MSSEWAERPLGEFVRLQRGHDLTAAEQRPGHVPVMGSAGANGTHDEALAKGPGVVIGRSGASIGRVHFAQVDYWPHNTCLYVTDFLGNSPRFAYYLLQTLNLAAFNSGSAQPSLNRNFIYSIRVQVPDRGEQDAIVEMLQSLDDRIAILRETNATLEAIAQALFKSWFVDFDPVRAKQQGLAPAGMDEATAVLFPATDEDWQAQASRPAASDLIASGALLIGDGYRAKNDELGQPGMPFVRAGDLDAGQITPTKDYLAEPAVRAAATKIAKPGDTAFTSKGTIGRFAFVDDASGEAVYSPQVCFWRSLRTDIIEPAYLHYWMKSAAFKIQVDVVRGQAAIMDYVSLADQRRMRLDLPPIGVQKRFAEVARVLLERISCNRATATYLTCVRDTLLPRLITGQLRLPEIEGELQAA